MKTIRISAIFPAGADAIWPLLSSVETLRYIAAPFAAFKQIDGKKTDNWREGMTVGFRLRIFGVLPLGIHKIRIEMFDRRSFTVQSVEGNKMVPLWNHKITLEPKSADNALYTDEVEIGAGLLTPFVCLWARAFYRHRQKRWVRLLGKAARG
jgi:hypothetical protein